jgi:hypothetical protein
VRRRWDLLQVNCPSPFHREHLPNIDNDNPDDAAAADDDDDADDDAFLQGPLNVGGRLFGAGDLEVGGATKLRSALHGTEGAFTGGLSAGDGTFSSLSTRGGLNVGGLTTLSGGLLTNGDLSVGGGTKFMSTLTGTDGTFAGQLSAGAGKFVSLQSRGDMEVEGQATTGGLLSKGGLEVQGATRLRDLTGSDGSFSGILSAGDGKFSTLLARNGLNVSGPATTANLTNKGDLDVGGATRLKDLFGTEGSFTGRLLAGDGSFGSLLSRGNLDVSGKGSFGNLVNNGDLDVSGMTTLRSSLMGTDGSFSGLFTAGDGKFSTLLARNGLNVTGAARLGSLFSMGDLNVDGATRLKDLSGTDGLFSGRLQAGDATFGSLLSRGGLDVSGRGSFGNLLNNGDLEVAGDTRLRSFLLGTEGNFTGRLSAGEGAFSNLLSRSGLNVAGPGILGSLLSNGDLAVGGRTRLRDLLEGTDGNFTGRLLGNDGLFSNLMSQRLNISGGGILAGLLELGSLDVTGQTTFRDAIMANLGIRIRNGCELRDVCVGLPVYWLLFAKFRELSGTVTDAGLCAWQST